MLPIGEKKVLLPVAPGEGHGGAVRVAADEARRRGCGVHVVSVLHPVYAGLPPTREFALLDGELRAVGTETLLRAEHTLQQLLADSDLSVSTELVHGPVGLALVDLSAHACLVVLQRRHHTALERIVTMSVTNGVAARAHAPVAVVPSGWVPPETDGPVVIGIEHPDSLYLSEDVVRLGLDLARLQGTPAEFTHGWWSTDAYDDLLLASEAAGWESADRRRRLVATLAPLLQEYADVTTDVVVRHVRPADLLVQRAAAASVLVVGRHHPSSPLGSHLGPITRAVLRESPCPVVVGTNHEVTRP